MNAEPVSEPIMSTMCASPAIDIHDAAAESMRRCLIERARSPARFATLATLYNYWRQGRRCSPGVATTLVGRLSYARCDLPVHARQSRQATNLPGIWHWGNDDADEWQPYGAYRRTSVLGSR